MALGVLHLSPYVCSDRLQPCETIHRIVLLENEITFKITEKVELDNTMPNCIPENMSVSRELCGCSYDITNKVQTTILYKFHIRMPVRKIIMSLHY